MTKYVPIPGSEKKVMEGAHKMGPVPSDERVEVTVRVRSKAPLPSALELSELGSKGGKGFLTHAEYEATYGADPADLAKVESFAKAHNLTVVEASAARRSVMLAGSAGDFAKAFQVSLDRYEHPDITYRGRTGAVHIPQELSGIIEGVFGLDNRPVARPRLRRIAPHGAAAAAAVQTFDPPQVAQLYNFPAGTDGTGQCIGIIELGGGYRPADLKAFFKHNKLKAPVVTSVSVDHGRNSPGGGDDGEVVLDIEVAGGVAPGAHIAVYFTNGATSNGFIDAVTKSAHDATNNPSVISISWGGPEDQAGITKNYIDQFNQAIQGAGVVGVTVCIASGDNGAADSGPVIWDGLAHVDFPASSPYCLACGGTRLVGSGGTISSEAVWNQHRADPASADEPDGSFGATGGGVSTQNGLPDYQSRAGVPSSANPGAPAGRGVPDVAGPADPETGYNIFLNGQLDQGFGGTSAVAPLWAGLIARINQKLGRRVGFINPRIYALPANSGAFHDITVGDNRVTFQSHSEVGYDAGPGWDPCTGLGSPDGTKLAGLL